MHSFFSNFLPNISTFFKQNKLNKDLKSDFIFILLISGIMLASISGLYSVYQRNVENIHEFKVFTVDLKTNSRSRIEKTYSLKTTLSKRQNHQWLNKIYPSSYDSDIENFLNNSLLTHIQVDITPVLVFFLEDSLTKSLYNNDIDSLLEAFKTYLMITGLEDFNLQYVNDWYMARIDKISLLLDIDTNLLKSSLGSLNLTIPHKTKLNKTLYTKIVEKLTSPNIADLIYEAIISKIPHNQELTMSSFLPKNFLEVIDIELLDFKIPYMYTKDSYNLYLNYQTKILKTITTITNLETILDRAKLIIEVEEANSMYVRDYLYHWNELIANIRFREADDIVDVLTILKKINSDVLLMSKFLQQIDKEIFIANDNEILNSTTELLSSNLDKLPGNNKVSEKARQFVSYKSLDQNISAELKEKLNKSVKDLTVFISAIATAQDVNASAFASIKKLENSEDSPINNAKKVFSLLPEPLNLIYETFIDDVKNVIYQHAFEHINDRWYELVYKFYAEKLHDKYPFNGENYNNQLLLKDFVTFFAKNGILDIFIVDYLSSKEIVLNHEAIEILEFAKQVKTNWFNDEGQLKVQFMVVPSEVSNNLKKVVLFLLGQEVIITHDKLETSSFIWSGQKQNAEHIKIEFTDKKQAKAILYFNGPWSWYKFLELDKMQSASLSTMLVNDLPETVIKSPVGDFSFSVTFSSNLPLLTWDKTLFPEKIIGNHR